MSLRMQLRAAGLGLVALATMGQSLLPPPHPQHPRPLLLLLYPLDANRAFP